MCYIQNKHSFVGYETEGIHQFTNPVTAVNNAQAIFVGGGNTFRLLKSLHDNHLVHSINTMVLQVIITLYWW